MDFGSGEYNEFTIIVEEVAGGSEVTLVIVDGADGSVHTPVVSAFVAGMSFPSGSRVALFGRTGGSFDFHEFDDINVQFIPEPSSLVLLSLGTMGLSLMRRKRRRA